jgi:hypothetical protein
MWQVLDGTQLYPSSTATRSNTNDDYQYYEPKIIKKKEKRICCKCHQSGGILLQKGNKWYHTKCRK